MHSVHCRVQLITLYWMRAILSASLMTLTLYIFGVIIHPSILLDTATQTEESVNGVVTPPNLSSTANDFSNLTGSAGTSFLLTLVSPIKPSYVMIFCSP